MPNPVVYSHKTISFRIFFLLYIQHLPIAIIAITGRYHLAAGPNFGTWCIRGGLGNLGAVEGV